MLVGARTDVTSSQPNPVRLPRKKSKAALALPEELRVSWPNQGFDPKTKVLSTIILEPAGTGMSGNWLNASGCCGIFLSGVAVVWQNARCLTTAAHKHENRYAGNDRRQLESFEKIGPHVDRLQRVHPLPSPLTPPPTSTSYSIPASGYTNHPFFLGQAG
mgnify:CR=1 FL=1